MSSEVDSLLILSLYHAREYFVRLISPVDRARLHYCQDDISPVDYYR